MLRRFLFAKLRGVRITCANLHYEGSISLDEEYLEKTGILPNEAVTVLNVSNGQRFETYVIKGERGSGAVELNGPAARLGVVGDEIMVLSYAQLSSEEIAGHTPTIVAVTSEGCKVLSEKAHCSDR